MPGTTSLLLQDGFVSPPSPSISHEWSALKYWILHSWTHSDTFTHTLTCSNTPLHTHNHAQSLMNILAGQRSLVQLCSCLCAHCSSSNSSVTNACVLFNPEKVLPASSLDFASLKAAGWLCERFSLPSCLPPLCNDSPMFAEAVFAVNGVFFSQPCSLTDKSCSPCSSCYYSCYIWF